MRPVKQRVVGASMLVILAFGVAVLTAAGSDRRSYAPRIDPTAFTATVENPYLPLRPGTRWVYEGPSGEGLERKVVEVTDETRVVMGVSCVVVHDTVTVAGQPFEDTFDWFAEDRDGTVWMFGEASRTRGDDGRFTPAGSWEAGVHGGLPGIVMPAHPRPGNPYRQEYLPGHAEDMARVISVTEALTVPNGSYVEVVVTRDWSPLDPGVADHKHYAPGIGMIREETVEGETSRLDLIERTRR
jgi:hypothetical protein